ncbi:RNA-binding domain-containing protein [Persicobacter diffluens]|uniref:S1 motif domain-containing protein n=1 Tax=Persicobacter diffluens TaxID=981 RepID=A0AAN4W558_9BACT|nr:hypothetical protein PEDI_53980 [Persicobacter diffluens]
MIFRGFIDCECQHYKEDCYKVVDIERGTEFFVPKYQLMHYAGIEIGNEYSFSRGKNQNSSFINIKSEPIILDILDCNSVIEDGRNKTQIQAITVNYKGKAVKVRKKKWQLHITKGLTKLKCEVERSLRDGSVVLRNIDNNHPHYEQKKIYDFKVEGIFKKQIKEIEKTFLKLSDEHGGNFEVFAINGQEEIIEKIKTVKCEVTNISGHVKLHQLKSNDPFFEEIKNIIQKDDLFINRYFTKVINKEAIHEINEQDLNKCIKQYKNKESFYIFTYVEKILPAIFKNLISIKRYKDCLNIVEGIIKIEDWIIEKGILKAFPKSTHRKEAKIKAKTAFNKYKNIKIALEKIASHSFLTENDYNELHKKDFKVVVHYIGFIDVDLLDLGILINYIRKIFKDYNFDEDDIYVLNLLAKVVGYKKRIVLGRKDKIDFSLLNTSLDKIEVQIIQTAINLEYIEYLINTKLGRVEEANIILSSLVGHFGLLDKNISGKKRCLFASNYYLDNIQNDHSYCLEWKKDKLNINLIEIENIQSKIANSLNDIISVNQIIKVKLTKKSSAGFDAEYNGIKGFIPTNKIKNRKLKRKKIGDCDIDTNIKCVIYDVYFNYFIGEHIDEEDNNYFFNDHILNSLKIGDKIAGEVKFIEKYGIFVSTKYGDGLLHIKNIFNFVWDESLLDQYFYIKQSIEVEVIEYSSDNKLSLSLLNNKKIQKMYYDYTYYNYEDFDVNFDEVNIKNEDDNKIALLKARYFEQSALFQSSIEEKLSTFEISKLFYSKTNNGRSYLVNIYIQYFTFILQIKFAIDKRHKDSLNTIIAEARKLRESINKETLSQFPDANIVIELVNLFSKFGKTDQESIKFLIEYSYSLEKKGDSTLLSIAKVILSNNIMVSEVKIENENFINTNLTILYKYLSKGVLSLKEEKEDEQKKINDAKISKLKALIKNDENQRMEFKASLLIPHPSEDDLKTLEGLHKQKQKGNCSSGIDKRIDEISGKTAEKRILHSAFKNLCAFANTDGGMLLIGVNDDKTIRGIEEDFNGIKSGKKNLDGYGINFDNLIKKFFGEAFGSLLSYDHIRFQDNKTVFCIEVKPSSHEVFLLVDENGNNAEEVFIRHCSSARQLVGKELVSFIKTKYNSPTNPLLLKEKQDEAQNTNDIKKGSPLTATGNNASC